MISFDTNVVFPALTATLPGHESARELLMSFQQNEDVVLCELVLLEVYALLRNPTVCTHPLSARAAADAVQALRHHPNWRIVDYDAQVADELWEVAGSKGFPYRRLFDARLALTLRHHGVTELASRNVKDFRRFGFERVWDPFEERA